LLLQRQNLFEEPMHFSFVFNVAGGTWYSLDMLTTFTRIIPPGSTWQGIGVGPTMWPVVTTSVANGGHIRVGLEDNIYISKGVLARGSWEQVEKAVRIARELDREPTTIDEAREFYHLKKR
ncbi:MAG: 3-keto-5-aminohexanoate cleavage protein, partial [Chloroflexota bacterium]